jgi:hypothetical protein
MKLPKRVFTAELGTFMNTYSSYYFELDFLKDMMFNMPGSSENVNVVITVYFFWYEYIHKSKCPRGYPAHRSVAEVG